MERSPPLVVIVLSSYNGEKYLEAQMESLFRQSHKNIRVIVRDDGSSDRTCAILERLGGRHENLSVMTGQNVGVVESFLRLLREVPSNADYVALCDQDDVWCDDKVERAVAVLADVGQTTPAMYCGAVNIVDEHLNYLGIERQMRRKAVVENALVQNIATGCTTVLNRDALRLVTKKQTEADRIGMHDWWLYLIVSALGTVVFDDVPKIHYRQHGGNVIGSASGLKFWINRVKRQLGPNSHTVGRQAAEFLRLYGDDLSAESHEMVLEFLDGARADSLWKRWKYALRTPVFRQRSIDSLLMRAMIVLARV